MSDDFMNNDPFGGQQTMTPDFNSFKTTGTNKLLVVLFVVDCSRSMEGDRIMAVNAALTEVKSTLQDIKTNNGLDLKIAIMSFTSSAKWELQLTDIDEVCLENLKTRPGLTQYGAAFHELNKVLCKEQYMKHTGKIAPPAIMFLTDGGPTDDYETDLDELLKNGWFANASRSAVLLGDAIHDDSAKNAVRRFVEDPDNDIVDAENSTVIIQKIKIATMHTVAGDPIDKGNVSGGMDTDSAGGSDTHADGTTPFGGTTPFTDPAGTDTTGNSSGNDVDSDPFGKGDPFNVNPQDPFGGDSGNTDPFAASDGSDSLDGNTGDMGGLDPFAASDGSDSFDGNTGDMGSLDPFAASDGSDSLDGNTGDMGSLDPFAASDGSDSFDGIGGNNPFGGMM